MGGAEVVLIADDTFLEKAGAIHTGTRIGPSLMASLSAPGEKTCPAVCSGSAPRARRTAPVWSVHLSESEHPPAVCEE